MTLLIVALAVYRFTRLVVADGITERLRFRLLSRFPSEDTVFTDEWVTHTTGEPETLGGAEVVHVDGQGWAPVNPHWLGELITCPWCVSFWIAVIATVALRVTFAVVLPAVGWVALPFALSAVAGLLATVSD